MDIYVFSIVWTLSLRRNGTDSERTDTLFRCHLIKVTFIPQINFLMACTIRHPLSQFDQFRHNYRPYSLEYNDSRNLQIYHRKQQAVLEAQQKLLHGISL